MDDSDRTRLIISVMAPEEVAMTIDRAAEEGWNPGRHDAACFRAADPAGFLAGRIDGRLVASISAVAYGGDFGFLGLYIVEPGLRGRGLGSQLWDAAMARLHGRTIGLDGVVAMQDAYARSGFVLAHRNVRMAGRLRHAGSGAPSVDRLGRADLDEVLDYDEPCFGARRRSFLEPWLTQPDAVAIGVRAGGRLTGFGVIRPARLGFKIGPLFADDADVASEILGGMAERIPPNADVFLDVPVPHVDAMDLAHELGMTPVFETARMYAGPAPSLPIERVFGVTTFELG